MCRCSSKFCLRSVKLTNFCFKFNSKLSNKNSSRYIGSQRLQQKIWHLPTTVLLISSNRQLQVASASKLFHLDWSGRSSSWTPKCGSDFRCRRDIEAGRFCCRSRRALPAAEGSATEAEGRPEHWKSWSTLSDGSRCWRATTKQSATSRDDYLNKRTRQGLCHLVRKTPHWHYHHVQKVSDIFPASVHRTLGCLTSSQRIFVECLDRNRSCSTCCKVSEQSC